MVGANVLGYTCGCIHPRDFVSSCKSTRRLLKAYPGGSERGDAGGQEGSAADKQEDLRPPDAAGEVRGRKVALLTRHSWGLITPNYYFLI